MKKSVFLVLWFILGLFMHFLRKSIEVQLFFVFLRMN